MRQSDPSVCAMKPVMEICAREDARRKQTKRIAKQASWPTITQVTPLSTHPSVIYTPEPRSSRNRIPEHRGIDSRRNVMQ